MKVCVISIGKPKQKFILEGWLYYSKRLEIFLPIEWILLNDITKGKNLTISQRIDLESKYLLHNIHHQDNLILLDEHGIEFTSQELSNKIYSSLSLGQGRLIFLIGGPYGTSKELKARANIIWSFSKLTLTHEMALLLLSEQIYRASLIYAGSKYNH